MPNGCEVFFEVIECDNSEQAEWLARRLTNENVVGLACPVFNVVHVQSDYDECGNFAGVAKVVADFQKQFKVSKLWMGSYSRECDGWHYPEDDGAVVVYHGEEYWFKSKKLAEEKASELIGNDGKK
jgi:hypothetical protein